MLLRELQMGQSTPRRTMEHQRPSRNPHVYCETINDTIAWPSMHGAAIQDDMGNAGKAIGQSLGQELAKMECISAGYMFVVLEI